MKTFSIAVSGLKHYFRSNLIIALGVAAATAVLTGALIVGDSMRHSLKELTLKRLGKIDSMLITQGFFREKLGEEIKAASTFQDSYEQAIPGIFFPGGTVESSVNQNVVRAGRVNVLGIRDAFWELDSGVLPAIKNLEGDVAVINQALADDLGIDQKDVDSAAAKVTIRIPKKSRLPSETALGKKTGLIDSLIDFEVIQIVPNEGLARFSLFPSQSDSMNIFIPIEALQDKLGRSILKHKTDPEQANVLFLSGKQGKLASEATETELRSEIRPTLEDYGLSLKRVTLKFDGSSVSGSDSNSQSNDQSDANTESDSASRTQTIFDYWSLSSDQMLLTEEAVDSIRKAFPDAKPLMTYLANDIKIADKESGIPFSMVTGVKFDAACQLQSLQGQEIPPLSDGEIVINQWAAEDLNAKVGDEIEVSYFLPEQTHGDQTEGQTKFELVGIARLTEPAQPFVAPRRGPLRPPVFDERPTVANDYNFTPDVPGVTDAQSVQNWDLPFQTADKIRPQDDDYWAFHRTTPKAFVSLGVAQKLWASRFGRTTSFRIPVESGSKEEISAKLLNQFASDEASLDMHLVGIKRRGLQASSGSTPFDVLFLALSMFVIGSALILVSLLFRLALQQRADEVGILKATGYEHREIRKLWLTEMGFVCCLGAVLGIGLGIGYAGLMIQGLTTWWVGAIARPFLEMHLSIWSLLGGLFSGALICVLTIGWCLRALKSKPVRQLLQGEIEEAAKIVTRKQFGKILISIALLLVAVGLAYFATTLAGEAQAGAFMGAGFLVLAALLTVAYTWLAEKPHVAPQLSIDTHWLALMSARRNPLRSTLTIGLVSVAVFLIVAVSAFRLSPSRLGTGGFETVGISSQPVFEDLGIPAGQQAALGQELSPETEIYSFRYKSGEDASCNNLYQSTQPQVLGLSSRFIHSFDRSVDSDQEPHQFGWGGSVGGGPDIQENPWLLLDEGPHAGTKDDPIPVIIDKNTANYSLKIYLPGTVREVVYDSGERFYFKAVGFLANTILQGSLLMSEEDFKVAFPWTPGYQYFLVRDFADEQVNLEDRLGDQGYDARSATEILSNFMAVQNTYLSTFQTLGALGLLLGTFGLAAVQLRSVFERRKELGLMRAVGYSQHSLARLVLLENVWLLIAGVAIGLLSAFCTTIPHTLTGSVSVPWASLAGMFVVIVLIGMLAAWLASRSLARMPLLESLRV